MHSRLYKKRQLMNKVFLALSWLATFIGLLFLAMIMWTLISKGMSNISLDLFTQDKPSVDFLNPDQIVSRGLKSAMVGSLLITLFALLIGTPIGILCGIYLAEFGRNHILAKVTRFINDILLSTPSIIIGMFVWGLTVKQFGHFSGWAGSLALSLLVIPVVVRTTENMLNLVPNRLREAAYALGTPKWKMTLNITLRAAKTGVLTGIILAFARIAGETAPLLFTSLGNNFYSADMNEPMANLPTTIYNLTMNNSNSALQSFAWTAAFIITLAVLFANICAQLVAKPHQSNR